MKPIRALLLAAGLGTRLRPLTLKIPKCLIEINNKPVIEYWIDNLERVGAEKILVNTHYLSEKVDLFLRKQVNRNIQIVNYFEKELLGTAGTLISNYKFFNDSLGILIHADNFTNFDLRYLIKAHVNRPSNTILTMLTFRTSNPENCGIVQLDSKNIVKRFYEKNLNPPGDIANGAVYVFEGDFMEWLLEQNNNAIDFSNDIIPKLMGRIYTYHTNLPYIDIGTPEALLKARKIVF